MKQILTITMILAATVIEIINSRASNLDDVARRAGAI